ncbi:hypothetical protein QFC22_004463 [Naganishia vaughanmartiniae]|uniref:Uncharacterized protein n=1 Tax=Naganishia vaughanmartiniae TaxID=1424756 RepID=A0ACC2X1H2_9TREE|nr:hypothetical protein QFC22_004463 [Naganishia vaughanmartiniae]
MKIKKHPKRPSVTHPDIEAVITRITACSNDADLPSLLRHEIPPDTPWRYPRADLHNWVIVLDRFDAILGSVLERYKIDQADATVVQREPFTEADKDMVLEILRFERILLDNSTSRKIYGSYDRMQALLFTSDLQVLHATILLILRPCQQYGSHTPFELSNNKIVRQRLLKLVMSGGGWGKLKELGYDMVKLAKMAEKEDEGKEVTMAEGREEHELDLPTPFYELSAQFYRPSVTDTTTTSGISGNEPGTATPVSTELERPTQELRIQPSPLGQASSAVEDALPAVVEDAELAQEQQHEFETPSRPSAASYLLRRADPSIIDTPITPFTPFGKPAATVPQQTSSSGGSSSITAFSRAYTNSDGLTVVYVPSSSIIPLVKDGSKDAMAVLAQLLESHPELRGIAEEKAEEKEEKGKGKEETGEQKEEGEDKSGDVAASTSVTASNSQESITKKSVGKYAAINNALREEQYDILCRLRIMLMMDVRDGEMSPTVKEDVTCMLEIRLAALATYLYLSPEEKAQSELFLYEPNMIAQLADLVNPNSHVSDRLIAPAFMALDACAHYRYKVTEVVTALNANVAHGILMNSYREVIRRLATEEGAPHELVDSVLSFVAYLASSSGYNNMLVGAGLVPLVIDLIKVTHPARGGYVARAIGLVDNMMYTSNNAFNIFCNASGLQTLNHRITVEVDRLINGEYTQFISTESDLLRRTTPLKLMLRSIHRLMQASGTVDALRSLIDSELPRSLLKIFNNVDKMGSSVFALAMHVTAAFVHNEPTSLSILQEMKLPDALYDAVEHNRQASFEILSALPNALGAFCLNQTGMDLTVKRREVLARLVHVCANPAYRDILRDRDNASFLGTSLDELARHHPPLKPILLEALSTLLKDLVTQGETAAAFNQWEPSQYRLMTVEDEKKDVKDVAEGGASDMQETANDTRVHPQVEDNGGTSYTFISSDYKAKKEENQIEITVDIVAQLMQGLFHNTQFGKDFLAQDGLKLVLDIYGSPSLRNSFATTAIADRLHIVLRSLAEASLSKVLNGIIDRVRSVMGTCRQLWDSDMQKSYLSPFIPALRKWQSDRRVGLCMLIKAPPRTATDVAEEKNAEFRRLVHLNNLLSALCNLYITVGFAHGKVAASFLQALGASSGSTFLQDLGQLHRACIWENILLKNKMASFKLKDGPQTKIIAPTSTLEGVHSPALERSELAASMPAVTSDSQDVPLIEAHAEKEPNFGTVKHIAHSIPAMLTPFFQGVIKMLLFRRAEASHKVQAAPTADILARIMKDYLEVLPKYDEDDFLLSVYSSSMVSLVHIFLFDERTTQGSLQTMLLVAFNKAGGMTLINRLVTEYAQEVEQLIALEKAASEAENTEIPQEDEETRRRRRFKLLHCYQRFQNIMNLVKSLVANKSVLESSQTAMMTTKDKAPTDPDYFMPQDLLISLRLSVFDSIESVWQSDWLLQAPLPITRSAVRAVLSLLENVPEPAPGAQSGRDTPHPFSRFADLNSLLGAAGGPLAVRGVPGMPAAAPAVRRPPVVNEAFVETLIEMGFGRHAATVALTRLNNNLPAATEYLLTHGHLIAEPEPEPAAAAQPVPAVADADVVPAEQPAAAAGETENAAATSSIAGEGAADTSGSNAKPADVQSIKDQDTEMSSVDDSEIDAQRKRESMEQARKLFQDKREHTYATLPTRAIHLVDVHDSLIFDFRNAFLETTEGVEAISRSLEEFGSGVLPQDEKGELALTARLRLLAVVAHQPTFGQKIDESKRQALLDKLIALPVRKEDGKRTRWLSGLLLGAESIFFWGESIKEAKTGDTPLSTIIQGPLYTEARRRLFDTGMNILHDDDLNIDEIIAILRTLVVLTRDRDLAQAFLQSEHSLQDLFRLFNISQQDGKYMQSCASLIAMIMRHLVEDEAILRKSMQREIRIWFQKQRGNHASVQHYVSNLRAAVLRDPDVFVQATSAECILSGTEPGRSGTYNIQLIDSKGSEETDGKPAETEASGEMMQVDDPFQETSEDVRKPGLQKVMQFLTSDLITYSKPEKQRQIEQDGTQTSTEKRLGGNFLVLTELLGSYMDCKSALLSSTKRVGKESAMNVRTRSPILNVLLNHYVTNIAFDIDVCRTHNHSVTEAQRARLNFSNWSSSAIVALCSDPASQANASLKDISPVVVNVRKTVMDVLARAIKEATSSAEGLNARYGRLWALSELCYRLLTAKSTVQSKSYDDSSLHIAKIMLEKGFVPLLTNVLGEIDLNYPQVKILITAIMQPLDYLTKLSMKMAKAEKSRSSDEEMSEADTLTSEEEDEDEEMIGPEGEAEAPDMYRNSSLGMFGGEMDDYLEGEDEGGDDEDDMEGDHYDEDDIGDEDSEGTEPSSDEDDEDGIELEEEWDEDEMALEEDEENEDEMEMEDDANEFMMDGGVEDLADGEAELMDGDGMLDDLDGMDGMEGDMEDEEGMFDEDGMGDEYDDEDDEQSEIYEEYDTLDSVVVNPLSAASMPSAQMNNWGWAQPVRTSPLDEQHGSLRRRGGNRFIDDGFALFGRNRSSTSNVASVASHPLLQEDLPSAAMPSSALNAHRPLPALNRPRDLPGLIRALDSLMGGNAMQVLETLAGGPGHQHGEHTIRIETGSNGTEVRVGNRSLHYGPGGLSGTQPTSNSNNQTIESTPQPTLNRWQEEEKIVAVIDAQDRLNRIITHVINVLLPVAREADREAKAKKAEEEALRKRKEEEEAARQTAEKEKAEQEAKAQREGELAAQEQEVPSANADVEMATEGVTETADRARVTIMIHGEEVDITETGIDPEFLQALPDDMREDVVNQHLTERRRAAVGNSQSQVASQISPEFLDALPPEIRAEVIQQEAIEAARLASGPPLAIPAPADRAQNAEAVQAGGARFLATLPSGLRELVMMGRTDEEITNSIQLGSRGMGANLPGNAAGISRAGEVGRPVVERGDEANADATNKKPPSRDTIQLLDKAGIASLMRLLFFPEGFRKNYLHRILGNLCENSKNRADVVNLLLGVLQDEAGDLSLIDKQSARVPTKPVGFTPKTTPRRKNVPETPATPLSSSANMLSGLQAAIVPSFVAQRSFEALHHIASNNEQVAIYFLTEHDLPATSKKAPAHKKGKGTKASAQPTYPLVILLRLLERRQILQASNLMEMLTALLAMLTKPLTHRLKKEPEPTDAVSPQPRAESIPAVPESTTATVTAKGTASQKPEESSSDSSLITTPDLPLEVLRLVVNILNNGECSSRTFSHTLTLIQHLSYIAEAKRIITEELRDRANSLGTMLTSDLQQLAIELDKTQGNAQDVDVSRFSPASSNQAKLLRMLKTLDYMHSSKMPGSSGWDAAGMASVAEGTAKLSEDEEKVSSIFESFTFNNLWDALGDCLSVIEKQPESISIGTVLLPLVESLMVVSKYSSAKAAASRDKRSGSVTFSPMSPREASTIEPDSFLKFTNQHRAVLNIMVRNNPSLMSGSFSLLVLNPRVLDFDNKRNWFTQQLRKKPANRDVGGTINLNVRRQDVFNDSYRVLAGKSGETIKYGKLNVKFHGEEGVDAGGVTREWYTVLAQSIFNPGYCLFEPCAADQLTYQPSQRSWVNPEHIGFFRFIGKMIGKAIYDGRLLDAYFSRAFYKQILGRKVDIRDLESVDPEYHKSLMWMLENDITGIIDLDFSLEVEEFGAKKVIDLKENGSQIPVTEENKQEYVNLVVEHRLESAIKDQIKAILDGFYEIIPRNLISIFDPDQLELLISGVSVIDVDELKNATHLHGWKNGDPEISWFWRALRSFSQEERARFLMFVTSSSRVPLGGFSQLQGSSGTQPFQIHKLYRHDVLPSSATCFNELLLPSYSSYEELRAKLLTAITETAGFGRA